jgi:hypothetical protein
VTCSFACLPNLTLFVCPDKALLSGESERLLLPRGGLGIVDATKLAFSRARIVSRRSMPRNS